ncbi:unnamed protein product [Sphagnum jensenii]|uniref:PHD-type zinc finger plants domain-containing protein n=1 Tax=Sphagnum jensenii TaxID=128206 RepID=A0ABP0XG62_9BRYO
MERQRTQARIPPKGALTAVVSTLDGRFVRAIESCSEDHMKHEEEEEELPRDDRGRSHGVECSMCGDVGFVDLLQFCCICQSRAQHLYCMAPVSSRESRETESNLVLRNVMSWRCNQCVVQLQGRSPGSVQKHDLHAGTSVCRAAATAALVDSSCADPTKNLSITQQINDAASSSTFRTSVFRNTGFASSNSFTCKSSRNLAAAQGTTNSAKKKPMRDLYNWPVIKKLKSSNNITTVLDQNIRSQCDGDGDHNYTCTRSKSRCPKRKLQEEDIIWSYKAAAAAAAAPCVMKNKCNIISSSSAAAGHPNQSSLKHGQRQNQKNNKSLGKLFKHKLSRRSNCDSKLLIRRYKSLSELSC